MSSLEGFRRGNTQDAARRAQRESPETADIGNTDNVDLDELIRRRQESVRPAWAEAPEHASAQGSPSPRPQAHPDRRQGNRRSFVAGTREAPTFTGGAAPKTVRSMNIPTELMVGLRVLAAVRNADHPQLLMAAVDGHAAEIRPAAEIVKRRRRLPTTKLLVKLTEDQTERLDRLAAERSMTRSSFITAVLDAYIPEDLRREL